jgi:hypothetical protein
MAWTPVVPSVHNAHLLELGSMVHLMGYGTCLRFACPRWVTDLAPDGRIAKNTAVSGEGTDLHDPTSLLSGTTVHDVPPELFELSNDAVARQARPTYLLVSVGPGTGTPSDLAQYDAMARTQAATVTGANASAVEFLRSQHGIETDIFRANPGYAAWGTRYRLPAPTLRELKTELRGFFDPSKVTSSPQEFQVDVHRVAHTRTPADASAEAVAAMGASVAAAAAGDPGAAGPYGGDAAGAGPAAWAASLFGPWAGGPSGIAQHATESNPFDFRCAGARRSGSGICSLMDRFFVDWDERRGTVRFYPRNFQYVADVVIQSEVAGVTEIGGTAGCPTRITVRNRATDFAHVDMVQELPVHTLVQHEILVTAYTDGLAVLRAVRSLATILQWDQATVSLPGTDGQRLTVRSRLATDPHGVPVVGVPPAPGAVGSPRTDAPPGEGGLWTAAAVEAALLARFPIVCFAFTAQPQPVAINAVRAQIDETVRSQEDAVFASLAQAGDLVSKAFTDTTEGIALAVEAAFAPRSKADRALTALKLRHLSEQIEVLLADMMDGFTQEGDTTEHITGLAFALSNQSLVQRSDYGRFLEDSLYIQNMTTQMLADVDAQAEYNKELSQALADFEAHRVSLDSVNLLIGAAKNVFDWENLGAMAVFFQNVTCPAAYDDLDAQLVKELLCEVSLLDGKTWFTCTRGEWTGLFYFIMIFMTTATFVLALSLVGHCNCLNKRGCCAFVLCCGCGAATAICLNNSCIVCKCCHDPEEKENQA